MLIKVYIVLLFALLLSACPKPFQPVAPAYKHWSKTGASELDVKKALLECGKPSPDPVVDTYKYAFGLQGDDMLNKFLMENACMENIGFVDRFGSVNDSCKMYPERKKLPACQLYVKPPKPSIERRLNSWYCKLKTDYQFCLKNAPNPKACNPEGHKKPPPECLP